MIEKRTYELKGQEVILIGPPHLLDEIRNAHTRYTKPHSRFTATINRLISNIPAACKILLEEGRVNLAGQLERDRRNLVYGQEHDFHLPEEPEEELT